MSTIFYELLDGRSIEQARATLEQFVKRLSAVEASVDPASGAITVDRAAVAGAVSDVIPLDIGGRMLAELRAIIDGGMFVASTGPVFPWRLLTVPGGATALGTEPLRQLGLPVDEPPNLWPIELASRFPAAPRQVATADIGQLVSDSAAVEAALLPPSTPVLPMRSTDGGGGLDGGGGGGGGGGLSLGIIDQIIGCFAGAQYELYWWGVRISLDESCANLLADILTGTSAGTVLDALKAAFAAAGGLLAAVGAAVAVAGGWAIAIIAICAYIFGRWLKSVITSAGAYIDCTWIGPVAWGR